VDADVENELQSLKTPASLKKDETPQEK
jgi:hypothetical protein